MSPGFEWFIMLVATLALACLHRIDRVLEKEYEDHKPRR